jgi:CMP-N-acetylneuraminic acid synthetase
MTTNEPRIIAMIPARMGSQRIPKKNIRLLDGKPLIRYAIDLAMGEPGFDRVIVNSESEELGRLAADAGAEFYRRPDNLSTHQATNEQFTLDFLHQHPCDYVVMVNTTSPLLRPATLARFVEHLKKSKVDTLLSVSAEFAECFFDDQPINFNPLKKTNSQNLVPVHKVIWALTAWKRESFLTAHEQRGSGVFAGTFGLFPIPKDESSDLDTEEDWVLAEALIEGKKKSSKPRYWTPSSL